MKNIIKQLTRLHLPEVFLVTGCSFFVFTIILWILDENFHLLFLETGVGSIILAGLARYLFGTKNSEEEEWLQ